VLVLKSWLKVSRDVWAILTNIIMLILVANVALAVLFLAIDKFASLPSNQKALFDQAGAPINLGTAYQREWFDYTAYEGIVDEAYAGAVLHDFSHLTKLGFAYQPWVQFSEPPYKGKLVNVDVDSLGFSIRRTRNEEQKEKSPGLRIFTFGGSNTFGYNVSDEHTWPSYLSDVLNKRAKESGLNIRIEVTNYGRGFYYSTQEVLLLEQLLRRGQRPNLVIFLDGGNEGQSCSDAPFFTEKLRDAMHSLQFAVPNIGWLPIVRLANALNQRLFAPTRPNSCENESEEGIEGAVQYEQNTKIARVVSELYNVKALFFLGPDAPYNYPTELYRDKTRAKNLIQPFYQYKEMFYSKARNIDGVVDLTSLFDLWGRARKAIIDDVHYSPKFNQFLAQHVADQIDLGSLVNNARDLAAKTESPDPLEKR
jgi:lysophospholipase L1-like esterase